MDDTERDKQNTIAQWAFDTRPILGRFHLWLEDVDVQWGRGEPAAEFTRDISFLPGQMERLVAMMGAVTALGTRLFGRFGEGAGLSKTELNQVKKDADAISAYAMSECLWYLSRHLPENHAIMVSLGEGLMPKAGETPEMGSNPQLGFGRVYARPEVARKLDRQVVRLLNDPTYGWEAFYADVKRSGITVWGAAIDTLENTSRFAKGSETGPLSVIHLFNQPLKVSRPYEGYVGNLILPAEIVRRAAALSVLVNFRTPRARVMEMIRLCYPDLEPQHVHVWCLRGKSRLERIGGLWKEWEATGAHLVDDGWVLPSGIAAFAESGTYAPTYRVGTWQDDTGCRHLFVVDGYAASAEAMQAASLAPMLGLEASLCVFTSTFKLPYDREAHVMGLDPEAGDFTTALGEVIGATPDAVTAGSYQSMIRAARDAGLELRWPTIGADDFFPEKDWDVLAVLGHICPDPYTGAEGVHQVGPRSWAVTVRLATPRGDKRIRFVLRMMEKWEESRLIFNPLLIRFFSGETYRNRAVKISDSGRIRNELQTLCLEALEFIGSDRIRVHFDRILPEVISVHNQGILLDVLTWYKANHPLWFSWLEIVPPGGR